MYKFIVSEFDNRTLPKPIARLNIVRKVFHELEGSIKFFLGNVVDTDTLANLGNQWNPHFSMTVLNSIFARLPSKLRRKVGRMGWERQGLHTVEDAFNSVHRNVAAKETQHAAKETINIDCLTVHDIGTWNHFQEF